MAPSFAWSFSFETCLNMSDISDLVIHTLVVENHAHLVVGLASLHQRNSKLPKWTWSGWTAVSSSNFQNKYASCGFTCLGWWSSVALAVNRILRNADAMLTAPAFCQALYSKCFRFKFCQQSAALRFIQSCIGSHKLLWSRIQIHGHLPEVPGRRCLNDSPQPVFARWSFSLKQVTTTWVWKLFPTLVESYGFLWTLLTVHLRSPVRKAVRKVVVSADYAGFQLDTTRETAVIPAESANILRSAICCL